MNKVFSLILVVLFSSNAYTQYSAMTYNIRYATDRDGINSWDNRKEWVADLVNYYSPNVLGIQEGLFRQVSFLDRTLVGYDFVGVGRDDADKEGEFSAIFYQSDKLEMIRSQTFWLSLTPEEPSFGWGANYRRVCTWAEFEVKESKRRFYVFNTHFDHESEEARIESAKLIHMKVIELNAENLPVLIMGDLNAIPDSEPIEFLNEFYNDSREISNQIPFGPVGTYNGFDTSHPLDIRIDYIFVSKDIQVDNYAVLSNSRENRTPSDHLPVFINFQIN
jgi:endonuclease/exonuclease/phosphatase family metal-dependent hydrolase